MIELLFNLSKTNIFIRNEYVAKLIYDFETNKSDRVIKQKI